VTEDIATKENLKLLVEGKLAREKVEKLIRLSPRDEGMFYNTTAKIKARWAKGVQS